MANDFRSSETCAAKEAVMANSSPFGSREDQQTKKSAEETGADRRTFLQGAALAAATLAMPRWAQAGPGDMDAILAEIEKRHDECVKRLQDWIRQPSLR